MARAWTVDPDGVVSGAADARALVTVAPLDIDEAPQDEILVATPSGVVAKPVDLATLAEQAKTYAAGARAAATRKAYRIDWSMFEEFCRANALDALPASPMTVGLFLARDAEIRAPATLARRLAAISTAHSMAGHHIDARHPAIRDVLRGVRRAKGIAPRRQAAPLTTARLRRLLDTCAAGRLIDLRDRALLLLGFAAALRQSEIVALNIDDVTVSEEGLRVLIRRSKGDQEGEGQVVAIGRTGSPTCPAAAYADWTAASGISTGAVFRRVDRHGRVGGRLGPEAVADMVGTRATRAGLADPERYTGHSLRAGLATAAAAAGVEERRIMETTRHRSAGMVRRYIREAGLFAHNLSTEVGL